MGQLAILLLAVRSTARGVFDTMQGWQTMQMSELVVGVDNPVATRSHSM
jgi:hypothetical protein